MLKKILLAVTAIVFTTVLVQQALQPPTAAKVFKKASEAVVAVIIGNGHGSGFQVKIGKNRRIVTNAHVCQGYATVTILPKKKEKFHFKARVLYRSFLTDLCLIEGSPFVGSLELAIRAEDGQKVYVVGFPFGSPKTMTEGILMLPCDFSAAIFPGNSGGPVLNRRGHVVGVARAKYFATGFGQCVPLKYLKEFLNE